MSNNSSQSRAEVSAAIYHYGKKLEGNKDNILHHENDSFIQDWRKKKGYYFLERMEIYEQLFNLGRYNKPINTISAQVTNDLISWGLDADNEARYVRKVAPAKFKRDYDDTNRENARLESDIDSLQPMFTLEKLQELVKSPDKLREVVKFADAVKDHALHVAKDYNIAILDHDEREPKVPTYKPLPGRSEEYYAASEVIEALEPFTKHWIAIRKKMEEFPNRNEEQARINATKIRTLVVYLEEFDKMLPSIADEKYAFSKWQWFNTASLEEQFMKHSAAKKSLVAAVDKDGKPTGQYRPLTRERVGDIKEKLWKDMQGTALAMDIQAWWLGLIDWRDISSQMTQRIADRRIRIHDKLSDKAFGV